MTKLVRLDIARVCVKVSRVSGEIRNDIFIGTNAILLKEVMVGNPANCVRAVVDGEQ